MNRLITNGCRNDRRIATWLLIVAGLVFAMIVVGGATRLTESGLSIVEWKPVTGTLPPMSEADWQAEFEAYKQFPEYTIRNRGMSLGEFKTIFWWEYGHRLLGRLIGLAFALPLLFFLAKDMVRRELKLPLFGLLALGGAQGLLGWYMVQSGLVHEPTVSHYRLAAHLGLALFILSALVWTAMRILHAPPEATHPRTPVYVLGFTGLVFLQSLMGALVAGMDAGLIYNEWPWMGEGLVPPDLLAMEPLIANLTENAAMVQFNHRMMAYLIAGLAVWLVWYLLRREGSMLLGRGGMLLLVLVGLQVMLGIWTLLAGVPVFLGTLHQGGAALVLAVSTGLAALAIGKKD